MGTMVEIDELKGDAKTEAGNGLMAQLLSKLVHHLTLHKDWLWGGGSIPDQGSNSQNVLSKT